MQKISATQHFLMLSILQIIVIATVALGAYTYGRASKEQEGPQIPVIPIEQMPVACTEEAKICPDGSAVGRSGPKCEFAPCPQTKSTTQSAVPTSNILISGVQITEDAKQAIQKEIELHLQELGVNPTDISAQERSVFFEVYKADSTWIFGIGGVTGSKNCVIPVGGSDCGGPGPMFLMLGEKQNGIWKTGVEYTDVFKQMVKEVPDAIMSADQKSVYIK